MTRSMTGFGRSTVERNGEIVTVELSAVNHRFLDCMFRMPSAWSLLEPGMREIVKGGVGRGKVTVSIRRDRPPSGRQRIRFDADVAQQYIEAARELAQRMNTTSALSLNTLAELEGVFYPEETREDIEDVRAVVQPALEEALNQFNAARESEGAALAADVAERLRVMREALAVIEERIPELEQAYSERLRVRVAELNTEAGLKEERIALEVAIMAEKTCVSEEVVRLKTHFEHAEELMASDGAVGRDLNFLTQEIQREVNTLGSKLRDIGVTREVLRIKSELEKLREQTQNIE